MLSATNDAADQPRSRSHELTQRFIRKVRLVVEGDRAFLLVPAQVIVGEFLAPFKEFPPRQRPASFSIDQALEKAEQQQKAMAASGGAGAK